MQSTITQSTQHFPWWLHCSKHPMYSLCSLQTYIKYLMSRVQKCNDESYKITVPDVMNAVTHLKDGKSDGYDGTFK